MNIATQRILQVLNEIEPNAVTLTLADESPKPMGDVMETLVPRFKKSKKSAQNGSTTQIDARLASAIEQTQVAAQTADVRYYRPLGSSRIPGITALRRVVRRFLEYIFAPMITDAVGHNAAVTRSLQSLCDATALTAQKVQSEQQLCAQLETLQEQVAVLIKDNETLYTELNAVRKSQVGLQQAQTELQQVHAEITQLNERFTQFVAYAEQAQLNAFRTAHGTAPKVASATRVASAPKVAQPAPVQPSEENANPYSKIDYFDFENHFRGSRLDVRNAQEQYLPYFADKKHVLDLGCGRGEFLELLKQHNVPAIGVDSYAEYVEFCADNDLDVVHDDAVAYLRACKDDGVDGIFAAQLVEHLTTEQLVELCNLSYKVLAKDGVLVLETPNPQSLCIFTNAFYIDPTHQKPVHAKTLQYLLEHAGFTSVDVVYTDSSKTGYTLPLLNASGVANLEGFNDGINALSNLLYGSQDYAIIAKK